MKNENKEVGNIYKENLMIMKLLISEPSFIKEIDKIKKKFRIPSEGFIGRKEKNKWLAKLLKKQPIGMAYFYRKGTFFNLLENIVKKFGLRYNFLPHIENYILSNQINAPHFNFTITLSKKTRGKSSGRWVTIKAYAPLTKEEVRKAVKSLKKLQKEFLPEKAILDLRPKIDIDEALKIEKEMERRKTEIKIKYTGYLRKLKETAEKSDFYKREFEKWKDKRPSDVEKKLIKYTSKEIAQEVFKTRKKAPTVRKIYERIKKRRKQLFS